MKRFLSLILLAGITINGFSQRILSLDSCRNLAIQNNKELRIAQEKINAAHYNKKAAFTNYLPKFDIMATYMRTQKEISLLSDEQKNSISNIGTATGAQLQQQLQQIAASNPALVQAIMQNPLLSQIAGMFPDLIQGIGQGLNGVGQSLVDAFRTDTRNMFAGAATLTLPLFLGGKIIASS